MCAVPNPRTPAPMDEGSIFQPKAVTATPRPAIVYFGFRRLLNINPPPINRMVYFFFLMHSLMISLIKFIIKTTGQVGGNYELFKIPSKKRKTKYRKFI